MGYVIFPSNIPWNLAHVYIRTHGFLNLHVSKTKLHPSKEALHTSKAKLQQYTVSCTQLKAKLANDSSGRTRLELKGSCNCSIDQFVDYDIIEDTKHHDLACSHLMEQVDQQPNYLDPVAFGLPAMPMRVHLLLLLQFGIT